MSLPLEGVKILDLTRALAGPYCTMILADMGAEVIKVETPKRGDDSRGLAPFVNGESAYYMSINRNKYGITLNLRNDKAKEVLKDLIMKSDVIVENFKPGVMGKMGFTYEEVKEFKPDIIYASCSGFGHSGPYMYRPAYDAVVQAAGGIMSITGQEGGPPTRVGSSIGDITAGIFTSIGILSALYEKKSTGKGQKVDVAMLDCQLAILENAIVKYTCAGIISEPQGNRHPSVTPFEPFICKDGEEIVAAIGNDNMWRKFCKFAEKPELLADERFKTIALRTENYDEIKPIMVDIMKERTAEEWLELFLENDVAVTRVNNIEQVVNDPQVKARGMIMETEHPVAGKVKTVASPINLSLAKGKRNEPAPVLGRDNDLIFKDYLGYSDEKIESLKEDGAC